MDQAIKKRWVKALLSGEYKQCMGQMSTGVSYCCLGVLAYGVMPESMSYKLKSGLSDTEATELARVNDEGVPFEMIAGLIDTAL